MNVGALADFTSHRIEGITRMGDTPFSVPLFSQIEGNLWTGGCPVGQVPREFQFVVSLYDGPYFTLPHQIVTKATLADSTDVPDERVLCLLARLVNQSRDIGPTLVHCQAGLNRSGLIAALALILRGMPAANAIALLREMRSPAVLCNAQFEAWLLRAVQ